MQASGANPFYRSFRADFAQRFNVAASTVATAIKIGSPVSYERARRAIATTNGTVVEVSDDAILEAKAIIDRAGIGCEPASAASLAGVRQLAQSGVIHPNHNVAAILTGHLLKDADATLDYHTKAHTTHSNRPIAIDATLDEVRRTLTSYL